MYSLRSILVVADLVILAQCPRVAAEKQKNIYLKIENNIWMKVKIIVLSNTSF
jgi:hypothetical protein